jgi:hypothetical protein
MRIILKLILEIGCESVGWIPLTQDRHQWLALVDMYVPYMVCNFFASEQMLVSYKKGFLH